MRFVLLALAVLVLCPRASSADGEVLLGRPRVLASPGAPSDLRSHLTSGADSIRLLTWPLPSEGPLLVLGIPRLDPAARAFADAFGLLPEGGDLRGGYVALAWHDGRRLVGAILADDAAALALARDEIRLRPGEPPRLSTSGAWRWVRPRARHRVLALDPARGLGDAADTAIRGLANVVLVPDDWVEENSGDGRARLEARGIRILTEAQLADEDGGLAILTPASTPSIDAAFVRRSRSRLGRGLLLAEDWNAPWCGAEAPFRIPTPPPALSPALLAQVEGVVVRQGPGALEILESLAGGLAPDDSPSVRTWQIQLLPVLPHTWSSPIDFLRRSARNLRQEAIVTHDQVPWMAPLAVEIEDSIAAVGATHLAVPYVPTPVVTDGHLDERAWAHAVRLAWPIRSPHGTSGARIEILALSDGTRLHLAFRTPDPHVVVEIRVRDVLGGESRVLFASDPVGRGDRAKATHSVDAPAFAEAWSEVGYVGEASFSARALAGEVYPTRVLEVEVLPTVDGKPTRPRKMTFVVVP